VAALLVSLALLSVSDPTPIARAAAPSMGAGIFTVDGTVVENLSLPEGGTYYLAVATDSASTYVAARLTFNGSLLAEENASLSGSTFVSLPPGDFSLSLTGHGRAALGWDFTNGVQEQFPDNATLVAFLAPSGPRVHVLVALGDARTIRLTMYDDGLRPVGNATASSDGAVDFLLPSSGTSAAYLVSQVTAGAPNGRYGVSWTSDPLNPPLHFTAWPLFLLWILVPIAVVFVVFVAIHRRRSR
jgi:hypothetical protein